MKKVWLMQKMRRTLKVDSVTVRRFGLQGSPSICGKGKYRSTAISRCIMLVSSVAVC